MTAPEDARFSRIYKTILDECELVLASDVFSEWKETERFQPGDLVVCGNSFLFREGQSTKKSALYLGMYVKAGPDFEIPPVIVAAKSRINLQFKRLSPRELSKYQITDLAEMIYHQLPDLGSILFSLVGRIGEPEEAEVPITKMGGFETLRYVPDLKDTAEISDNAILIGNITDLDKSWASVRAALAELEVADSGSLGEAFESAFHTLQEESSVPVDLTDISEDAPSILSNVLRAMQQQVEEFSKTLEAHQTNPNDNEIYNELLRVAYNFADGTSAFMHLMVGLCDLKPLLFWLTIFEQVELTWHFEKLPFSLVGKGKPSLERYRGVIANARNQAFHDLFAFDHPFRVKLPGDALRSPELRLFREHAKRGGSALDYQDRELVDLFATLTRTPERPVPVGFWQGNQHILKGVVEAVHALRRALIVLAL